MHHSLDLRSASKGTEIMVKLDGLKQQYQKYSNPMVVTEVTRMKNGVVCVAAIDIATKKTIRPLQPTGDNWEETKWYHNDIMKVGNVVEVERYNRAPTGFPHATEDTFLSRAGKIGSLSQADLYEICRETADQTVSNLFSKNIVDNKYVPDGIVCRSLGCVTVPAKSIYPHVEFDKVRLRFIDADGTTYDPPVTEMQTKETGDAYTGLAALQKRLDDHGRLNPIVLRLGLTRGWAGPHGEFQPKRCTIQVNGLIGLT